MEQSPQRLIEIEHQYARGSTPLYQMPCVCLTPRAPAHLKNPVHHHRYFKVATHSFKPPPFKNVCRISRGLIKENSKAVCLDNFDPHSAEYQQHLIAPRMLDLNSHKDVVVFGDRACKTSLLHMCLLTKERDIDLTNIGYTSDYSTLCCHFSDEYDPENRDMAPWDWPGLETLQILHGIDLACFQNVSHWSPEHFDSVPSRYPGCQGVKKLYNIGTSDLFQQLGPGKIDENTFFRKNYDTIHADYGIQSREFLIAQKDKLARGLPIENLSSMKQLWNKDNFKIRFVQLAQPQPNIPHGWHYRGYQIESDTWYRIADHEDLRYLKIIAKNGGCSIQIQTEHPSTQLYASGERAQGYGPIIEIGIIGPPADSTRAVLEEIMSFDQAMSTGSAYPQLKPNLSMCACNTTIRRYESCIDCNVITARMALPPLPPLYTSTERRAISAVCDDFDDIYS